MDARCCLLCGVPTTRAPEFFEWGRDSSGQIAHCRIWRQPQTAAEQAKMREIVVAQDMDCIQARDPG